MHKNVDGDVVRNVTGNSEKFVQHCFRQYDPKCQTLFASFVSCFSF